MRCHRCNSLAERVPQPSRTSYRCTACGSAWSLLTTTVASEQARDAFDLSSGAISSTNVTIKWRSPRKRLISIKLAVIAASAVLLLLFAGWGLHRAWRVLRAREAKQTAVTQAPPDTQQEQSTWLPDPAIAATLNGEAGIASYHFRAPADFSPFPLRQQPAWLPRGASYLGASWIRTPGRQALIVASEIKYPTAEMNGDDLSQALERFYDRMQRNVRASNFVGDAGEIGSLAGKRFIKAAFSGAIKFDQDLPRQERAGQVLIHLEGNVEFTFYFLCDAEGSRDLYRQLETSLLTLRDDGHSRVGPTGLKAIQVRQE